MRIAYADPPYIGQAARHYSHDPQCAEVDHKELIARLGQFDGWALSCSSPSLRQILPMCPEKTRVMAWVKPFASFKPNVNPAYAWEPVLVMPARARGREEQTFRDWIARNITIKQGLAGAKPLAFSFWLFEVLGMKPEDEFIDMFPGTHGVSRAWGMWCAGRQSSLPGAMPL